MQLIIILIISSAGYPQHSDVNPELYKGIRKNSLRDLKFPTENAYFQRGDHVTAGGADAQFELYRDLLKMYPFSPRDTLRIEDKVNIYKAIESYIEEMPDSLSWHFNDISMGRITIIYKGEWAIDSQKKFRLWVNDQFNIERVYLIDIAKISDVDKE